MKIQILLGWAPREIRSYEWDAPLAATVSMALDHLHQVCLDWQWDAAQWHVAIWGQPADPNRKLANTDRVEVLRGLRVDPKVARRERFEKQGSRSTGLFAKRREGGKQGY